MNFILFSSIENLYEVAMVECYPKAKFADSVVSDKKVAEA